MDPRYSVLDLAARLARDHTDGLGDRPVGATAGLDELRARLTRTLTDAGEDPRAVVEDLAHDVEGGLVATGGPRFFGFVIGGALPVAIAADWLTGAWDQNGGGYVVAPALSVVEEVAAGWVRDLLGLPAGSGVGFVTGGQMANFTCLAAARHAVLRDAGWDVEADGLQGAPEVRVVAGEQAHVTVAVACRMLGFGADRVRAVAADGQGRMRPEALRAALAEHAGPTIVCARAREINQQDGARDGGRGRARPTAAQDLTVPADQGSGGLDAVHADDGTGAPGRPPWPSGQGGVQYQDL